MRRAGERRRRRVVRGPRHGGVAVEFGLLALPLLACIFATLEIMMVMFVSATLDAATADIARQIRTGQLQLNGGATSASMENALCAEVGWLAGACPGRMFIDVRVVPTFTSATPPNPVANGHFDPSNLQDNLGVQGNIVLVTTFFEWPLIAPVLDGLFQPLANGSTVITSSATFRNEPYEAN